MMFTLPKLPYAYDALEPYIDKETMQIHHTKHHQAYIDKLNAAIENDPQLSKMEVKDLLTNKNLKPDIKTAVINNAGGHYNHSVFWEMMVPGEKFTVPEGIFSEAVKSEFGNISNFQEKFFNTAVARFGSGWAWLVVNKQKKLDLYDTANQDSPVSLGDIPILGIDVWEHAYYLKYQNRRADYVKAWWNVVNWEAAENNFKNALKRP